MNFGKALLLCFAVAGCAAGAPHALTGRLSVSPPAHAEHATDGARLGPPNPRGVGARHVD
jgi:hypothetical protein